MSHSPQLARRTNHHAISCAQRHREDGKVQEASHKEKTGTTSSPGALSQFTVSNLSNESSSSTWKMGPSGLVFCDHEEGDEFVRHTIYRQEDGTWKNGPDEERKVYKAPFTDKELASIATHVNPFFLAWNAGRNLDELSEEKIASLPPTIIDDAKQILALYRSWATTVSVSKKLLAPSPSPLVLTRVRPAPNALKRKDREESPSEAAAERKRRRTSLVSTSKSTGTRA